MKPQGTYLIWLDFSAYELEHAELFDILHCKAKLILNDGLTFGKEGKHHARLNVATPFDVIEEACQRLGKVLDKEIRTRCKYNHLILIFCVFEILSGSYGNNF